MKKVSVIIIAALAICISSCKEEYTAPVSNTVEMAGRWWVELYADGDQTGVIDPDNLIFAYEDFGGYGIVTSNTAANDVDSVLIDDPQGSWPFKIKAPVNYSNLLFNSGTVANLNEDLIGETVTIISGKILKGAAKSKSGAVADSIFLEFEFSDDAGSYYIYSGHRDSGLPEDHY